MELIPLFEARPIIKGFDGCVESFIEKGLTQSGPEGRKTDGFVYVIQGRAHYELEGGEIKRYSLNAKAGDFVFLAKHTVYAMTVKSDVYHVIIVNFDFLSDPSQRIRSVISPNHNDKSAEKQFRQALSTWQMQEATVKEKCLSVLYALYANLLSSASGSYRSPFSCARMNEALRYINQHLAEETLTAAEAAEHVHLSESHFRRLFKEIYRISPTDYIITQRINLAKEKIRYSNDSITSISEATGFSSIFCFSHAFKRLVGSSPSQYRKHYRPFPKT